MDDLDRGVSERRGALLSCYFAAERGTVQCVRPVERLYFKLKEMKETSAARCIHIH